MLCISDDRQPDFMSGYSDLFDSKTFVAFRCKSLFLLAIIKIHLYKFIQEEKNEKLSAECR